MLTSYDQKLNPNRTIKEYEGVQDIILLYLIGSWVNCKMTDIIRLSSSKYVPSANSSTFNRSAPSCWMGCFYRCAGVRWFPSQALSSLVKHSLTPLRCATPEASVTHPLKDLFPLTATWQILENTRLQTCNSDLF